MLNDYRQLIAGLRSSVWLIQQESLEVIVEIVNMRLSGEAFSDEEIRLRLQEVQDDKRDNPRVEVDAGVGVISLYGPMFPKANLMTELSGATSLETFRNDLTDMVQNDSVKQIVLDMDTPGGEASMVPETGKAIKEAAQVKPVYAIANTMAASGGLWLASQATKFYATESGKVGSLGAYQIHEDRSKRDAAQGTKITFVSAGKYKTAGNPHEPLDKEAKEYIQEHVDEIYSDFVEAVAEGREVSTDKVLSDYGQGKVLSPKKALKVGMIDGIVTLDDLLGELVSGNTEERVSSLSTAVRSMHSSGGSLIMDKGGRSRIKNLLGGKDMKLEHAPEEHADPPNPGEDAPTNADTDRALGDEGGEGGSRRDTPPIETEGGEDAMELEAFLRETFEIPEDAKVEDFMARVHTDLEPVRQLETQVAEKAAFAKKYPEEAARLERLDKRDREHSAKSFSSRFERITKKEGDKETKTDSGLPQVSLELIESTHMKFSDGTVTVRDFEECIETIVTTGQVDYGETGSSRSVERDSSGSPAVAFSERVAEVMKEDKLEYNQALKVAMAKHPEEFKLYRQQAATSPVEREAIGGRVE